jgi:hypothetical protein
LLFNYQQLKNNYLTVSANLWSNLALDCLKHTFDLKIGSKIAHAYIRYFIRGISDTICDLISY